MIRYDSLVVSVPASALGNGPLPGSVFPLSTLRKLPVAAELQLAVDVVAARCPRGGDDLKCIARPEMFTHGQSLAWLKERIGEVSDHLYFSDGHTLKLVPGLQNHLFTYGLQFRDNRDAFRRLMRWAPELLGQVEVQINSFHRLSGPSGLSEPFPLALLAFEPTPVGMVWFYGLYLNPHSAEDSANQMLSWGELAGATLPTFDRYSYLALTETALQQAAFVRMLAARIERAYFDARASLLVRLQAGPDELKNRLIAALQAILHTGVQLPRTRAKNIFFLSGDLPEVLLRPLSTQLSFVFHQSSDFWRFTRRLYAEAGDITLYLDKEWQSVTDSAVGFATSAFGRPTQLSLSARVPRPGGET